MKYQDGAQWEQNLTMSERPTGTIKRQEQNLVSGPRTASEDLSARHVSESFICHKKHNHCVIIAASLVR